MGILTVLQTRAQRSRGRAEMAAELSQIDPHELAAIFGIRPSDIPAFCQSATESIEDGKMTVQQEHAFANMGDIAERGARKGRHLRARHVSRAVSAAFLRLCNAAALAAIPANASRALEHIGQVGLRRTP